MCSSAFIALAWTVSEDIEYGICYGLPWLWAIVCTVITIGWVRRELEREEREWGDREHVHREKKLKLDETDLDRDVYAMVLERERTISVSRSKSSSEINGDGGGGSKRRKSLGSWRREKERSSPPVELARLERCTSV